MAVVAEGVLGCPMKASLEPLPFAWTFHRGSEHFCRRQQKASSHAALNPATPHWGPFPLGPLEAVKSLHEKISLPVGAAVAGESRYWEWVGPLLPPSEGSERQPSPGGASVEFSCLWVARS